MKFTSVPQTICQATEYWMKILQVSVSMRPYNYTNTTYVKFGVLPDPRNTSMSIKSINALRTSLIRLTLQQLNLSLTPSVFGDPLCLEILGFPGGITVLLPHNASHSDSIQPIFSITFDSTIREVRGFLEEMRSELALILQLTPDEVTPTLSLSCTFFSFKDLDMTCCKVIDGECVVPQHKLVVADFCLRVRVHGTNVPRLREQSGVSLEGKRHKRLRKRC